MSQIDTTRIFQGAFDRSTRDAVGAALDQLATDLTTAETDIDNLEAAGSVAGVASGYKLARGTLTPDAASKTVVTGLATVVAAVAGFRGAPSLTHMFVEADVGDQAGSPAAGSILIRSKKPTAAGDVTPIDATTPWSAIDWIAIGT